MFLNTHALRKGLVAAIAAMMLSAPAGTARADGFSIFLPVMLRADVCPTFSSARFDVIAIDGGTYKDNRLTDENADLRLSVLGYEPTGAPLSLVDYNGATDPLAPKLHGVFKPNRTPVFARAYKRHDWNWNESAPPPYGSRGGVNNDWPVSVIDFAAGADEAVHIPERGPTIGGGFNAMVLYADVEELTLVYYRQDSVVEGYLIHMANFCVDPNLVALYRAQTSGGKRSSGSLPGLSNNQRIGTAKGGIVTIAVRDRGAYLDPRSRKDWW